VLGIDENIRHIRYHRYSFFHLFTGLLLELQRVLHSNPLHHLIIKGDRISYVLATIENRAIQHHARSRPITPRPPSESGRSLLQDRALAATKPAA
jgi:hypothetical protein